jgi:hypothetical protein
VRRAGGVRRSVSREWSGGVFGPRGKKVRRSGPSERGSGLDCCVGWAAGKGRGVADWAGVTPGLQKDINRAIIYVPGSSHTYIQQNEQYITAHITNET